MSMLWPIIRGAVFHPKRLAVIDDHRKYSYGQLLGGALFVAGQIAGTTNQPHVGVMLPTSGLSPMAILGTWLTGKAAVPLNYLLNPDELAYVIADSGIDTIVTVGPMLEFLGGEQVIPEGITLIKLDEMSFKGIPPLRWPPLAGKDDLAAIVYTSGTSGHPKGVMQTHGNLLANVKAGIRHANITHADKFLGVLPQFHSFGLTVLTLIPLYIGSTVIYTARFIPRKLVELIRKHRPDIFMAVPSMYGALLTVKQLKPDDLSSIRLAVSGAEPLPDAMARRFKNELDLTILEGYGLTETSPADNWCTHEAYKEHSVGRALPGVVQIIVDEQNQPLPADCEGEILIAGPNVMKGYYNLPDKTDEVMVQLQGPDGKMRRYFRTGDIGKIDGDGFLFITGRKKEMLIIGGENVFPREIEEVLIQHDSVISAAVIGRSDDMRGEVPIAFVELADNAVFDEAGLRSLCREKLAGYKVPREIRPMEKLPRNPTGKILRRELPVD